MTNVALKVKEDVCLANGKDPAATELIEKMKLWGEVTTLESEIAKVKAEYQAVIDNLTKQIKAIQAQELTPDEIVLLNSYRDCKAVTGEAYQRRIDGLEKCLEDVRISSQRRAAQIAQLVAELAEVSAT